MFPISEIYFCLIRYGIRHTSHFSMVQFINVYVSRKFSLFPKSILACYVTEFGILLTLVWSSSSMFMSRENFPYFRNLFLRDTLRNSAYFSLYYGLVHQCLCLEKIFPISKIYFSVIRYRIRHTSHFSMVQFINVHVSRKFSLFPKSIFA